MFRKAESWVLFKAIFSLKMVGNIPLSTSKKQICHIARWLDVERSRNKTIERIAVLKRIRTNSSNRKPQGSSRKKVAKGIIS